MAAVGEAPEHGSGLGVERQEKDLRKLARERGYEVANVYTDNDVSASDPNVKRPAYERMLADVAAGSIDIVLAWDDDRLVRQPRDLERFFEVLDNAGATYATTSTTVDVATGEGMLIARIKGAVAAEEVRKLSRRSQCKRAKRIASATNSAMRSCPGRSSRPPSAAVTRPSPTATSAAFTSGSMGSSVAAGGRHDVVVDR